jgi:hypothetical protein
VCGFPGDGDDCEHTEIQFFDPQELANLETPASAPQEPYATLNLSDIFYTGAECHGGHYGGIAYDKTRGLLYITEPYAYSYGPWEHLFVVHVWRVHFDPSWS